MAAVRALLTGAKIMTIEKFFKEVEEYKKALGGLNKWPVPFLKMARLRVKEYQRQLATSAYSRDSAKKLNDFMGKLCHAMPSIVNK